MGQGHRMKVATHASKDKMYMVKDMEKDWARDQSDLWSEVEQARPVQRTKSSQGNKLVFRGD